MATILVALTLNPGPARAEMTSFSNQTRWLTQEAEAYPPSSTAERGAHLEAEISREIWLMGTRFRLQASGPGAADALETAIRVVEESEALLSTWRSDTPLSLANHQRVGLKRAIPAPLASLLAEVERWSADTGRAFEPIVGALVDAWDLRGLGRQPADPELEVALNSTGPQAIRIDPESGQMVRHSESAWIDSGGFGKGAALRSVVERLAAHPSTSMALDLGGQLWVSGPRTRRISIAHPLDRDRVAVEVHGFRGSMATSGNSERPGHILDPRSGRPVDWPGSVTVLHPDPLVADILSTALFVMGPQEGRRWLTRHPEIAALILQCDGDRLIHYATPAVSRGGAALTFIKAN